MYGAPAEIKKRPTVLIAGPTSGIGYEMSRIFAKKLSVAAGNLKFVFRFRLPPVLEKVTATVSKWMRKQATCDGGQLCPARNLTQTVFF
jgi:NAD(P)-dependent dehydrogenase (short-subunit alcohol dehydrogenase family)